MPGLRERVLGMSRKIRHRGPDWSGIYQGPTAILAHAELDLAVFAKIAQALGLSSRYAGEEKSSHVTALYNETMARALPEAGLRFCEIPRLGVEGETVSASTVRQAIHDGELERFRHLLPETTYRYFMGAEAAPVVAAIRAMPDPRHY